MAPLVAVNMRILLVSQTYLRKELGAAKVVIELAEEMEALGWKCTLTSLPELVSPKGGPHSFNTLSNALQRYLLANASKYDVVDYDHIYLPFQRDSFDPRPLFVARSILLHREPGENPIPRSKSLKSSVRSLLLGRRDDRQYRELVMGTRMTVSQADLVNVANHDDKLDLLRWGVAPAKIVVLPYGLSPARQRLFERISVNPPASPVVAFVGTFDSRKGAADFPRLVAEVTSRVPGSSFLLLGTARSEDDVLSKFPFRLRRCIKVIPYYAPDSLPELLSTCSVGIFPSYLEAFGFGVLEMLAAALPVIAYDAPGPPMMLPRERLVPRGDIAAMSSKVIELLKGGDDLKVARAQAKERASAFSWREIARETSSIYLERSRQRSIAGVG